MSQLSPYPTHPPPRAHSVTPRQDTSSINIACFGSETCGKSLLIGSVVHCANSGNIPWTVGEAPAVVDLHYGKPIHKVTFDVKTVIGANVGEGMCSLLRFYLIQAHICSKTKPKSNKNPQCFNNRGVLQSRLATDVNKHTH
jgi:hypothetical protein